MGVFDDGCCDKENQKRYADDHKRVIEERFLEIQMQEGVDRPLRSASGTPESSRKHPEGTLWKKSISGRVEQSVDHGCCAPADYHCQDKYDSFFTAQITFPTKPPLS